MVPIDPRSRGLNVARDCTAAAEAMVGQEFVPALGT